MKTFEEYLTENKQIKAFLKPPEFGERNSVSFEYRSGPGKAAASLKGIGDWRNIVNALNNNNADSIKITSDLKKKVPKFVLNILDRVRTKGYEVELIDKHNK